MGDESPTIDEINRQNDCLKKCADTFSKVEQAWMKMYDDKIISLERVQEEFRKARDDHQKCIDKCVPQRRHFTDEQKEHFETAGLEFAGIGAISAIAGFGAATLFDAPVAGGAMIGFGAACVAITYVAGALEYDPVDPNFSKVPVPAIPKLPAVRPVRKTALNASVARAVNAVLANQAQAMGLLNALLAALDRSDGAAKAGDASAEERQLRAARDFAKKVAKVFRDSMSLRLTLASKWTGPGLDFTISERDALQLRDQIIVNGFSPPFLDRLKKLGIDGNDRDILLQRLIVELANLRLHQIRFRDLLVDQKLRTAELRLASSLEHFSRSR